MPADFGINTAQQTDTERQLLIKILNALNPSGAVTGIQGGAANYAGVAPAFVPAGGFGVAVDTSNGRVWWYYNGQWN